MCGERHSLVRVERDEYDQQAEYAKTKHREHFQLCKEDCIETSVNPIEMWEYDEMKNKVVTLE